MKRLKSTIRESVSVSTFWLVYQMSHTCFIWKNSLNSWSHSLLLSQNEIVHLMVTIWLLWNNALHWGVCSPVAQMNKLYKALDGYTDCWFCRFIGFVDSEKNRISPAAISPLSQGLLLTTTLHGCVCLCPLQSSITARCSDRLPAPRERTVQQLQ